MSAGMAPSKKQPSLCGEHADGRGVHDGVEVIPRDLLPDQGLGAAGFGQRPHAIRVAAGQRDLRAGVH